MPWKKMGHIFSPAGNHYWNKTHASVPTVYKVNDNVLRIYYASRDDINRSYVGYIDVNANEPRNIKYIHDSPVICPGNAGMFDDCGVMPSHVIDVGPETWMYYLGWNIRNTIAYHNSIGLAISKDGGKSFNKFSEGPLFDRDYIEPYYSAVPYILREKGLWRMWYLSNTKWVSYKGKMEPFYHIKYAESKNGIDWSRNGQIAIDYKDENECGIVRPCVIKEGNIYKMWYSHRNLHDYRINIKNSYRIGFAISYDAIHWERKDAFVGIDISEEGWDSEMIEYPFVYLLKGRKYMIYNGNYFGKSGFGYAIWED